MVLYYLTLKGLFHEWHNIAASQFRPILPVVFRHSKSEYNRILFRCLCRMCRSRFDYTGSMLLEFSLPMRSYAAK